MCVGILGSRSHYSIYAAGHSRLNSRKFLPMWLLLPGFKMIVALCHNSGVCPVEIDRC